MAIVVVVDDSKFSRSLSRAILREMGHQVVEADNGKTGLEAIARHNPELVLLDLLMPGMDGIECLRHIRSRTRSLPVIVMTADIQATSRTQCEALGVTGFLNKPIRPEEVQACIEQRVFVKA